MTKKKYQWHSPELRQRAKQCQWAMLILGAVGVLALFTSSVPLLVGVLLLLLVVNIYASKLRSKDKIIVRK